MVVVMVWLGVRWARMVISAEVDQIGIKRGEAEEQEGIRREREKQKRQVYEIGVTIGFVY